MSLITSRRRTALRAAVATAALAGAVLAPAASAFADTAPGAAAPAAADESTAVRTVSLKGGLTAEVRRHADTAAVFYTADILKGDRKLGTLTAGAGKAAEERRVFEGIEVTLTGTGEVTSVSDTGSDGQGTETPDGVLVRTDALKGGLSADVYRYGDEEVHYSATVRSGKKVLGVLVAGHGFDKEDTEVFDDIAVTLYSDGRVTSASDHGSDGQGPETPVKCVATIKKSIGAGTEALLTISPSGPSVVFQGAGDGTVIAQLDRTHPRLPDSAGFVGEILGPDSHAPRLRTNMEGGGHPATVNDFPRLPEGCSFTYGDSSGSGAGATGGNAAGAQTTVVPKGSVAAGAEFAPSDDRMLVTSVGGGAAALGAAGICFVALRRRTGAAGR
ncbi:hypothetical protein ACGFYA_04295 [Streptomyces sp. NPDC048305]|uniref:hypothetical protein n=1 Tax=Streptomyces sp. NPDC048305 TaxID=3365532 RepID=UPI003724BEFB